MTNMQTYTFRRRRLIVSEWAWLGRLFLRELDARPPQALFIEGHTLLVEARGGWILSLLKVNRSIISAPYIPMNRAQLSRRPLWILTGVDSLFKLINSLVLPELVRTMPRADAADYYRTNARSSGLLMLS